MNRIRKHKTVVFFAAYGLAAGLASAWWRQYSDGVFPLNLPGVIIGDMAYAAAITMLGNPISDQAHYSIPWMLRTPQVYVPASLIFWCLAGLALQRLLNLSRRKQAG